MKHLPPSRRLGVAVLLAAAFAAPGCLRPGLDDPEPAAPENPSAGQYGAEYAQPQGPYGGAPGQYAQQGPYAGPGQYAPPGPGQAAPGQPPQGYPSYPQQMPPPGQYPAQPGPGPIAPQPAAPPPGFGSAGVFDFINAVDKQRLRNEAAVVLVELINALPQDRRARVHDVPLNADPRPGEVNAFAACDDAGKPLMAISDELLQIEAHVARFKANDEIFGTRKLDAYMQLVAANLKENEPIARPQPGFVDARQDADPRKVARQHVLLDEQLAFVLGHELAHHYLGHTGCANGQGGSRASGGDLDRVFRRVAGHTGFNQGFEVAADVAGTNNLLTAGSRRQGAKWNEEGALLTLDFFARLQPMTPISMPLSFFATHPLPALRRPVVQQAAASWRASGGVGWQIPSLPGIFGG
ncbi:MAG TPA: M48 family metalloprotease [Minicystis sp.]|nr:M48 family metalloprotease [Minicystis sp.]